MGGISLGLEKIISVPFSLPIGEADHAEKGGCETSFQDSQRHKEKKDEEAYEKEKINARKENVSEKASIETKNR